MSEGPSGAWQLPEELVMLRDTVRRFMDAHVHPVEEKLDHDTVGLPREQLVALQAKAREAGLWSLQTPEEYGGAGLSVLGQVVVAEEAAKCRMGAFFPALGAFGGNPQHYVQGDTRTVRKVRPTCHRWDHVQGVHRDHRGFRWVGSGAGDQAQGDA